MKNPSNHSAPAIPPRVTRSLAMRLPAFLRSKSRLFGLMGLFATALAAILYFAAPLSRPEKLSFPQFVERLEAGQVTELKLISATALSGKLEGSYRAEVDGAAVAFTAPVLLQYQSNLSELLAAHGFPAIEQSPGGSSIGPMQVVSVGIFGLFVVFLLQVMGVINLAPTVGKKVSARVVRFADVAGVDEAKEEILEVVNLIKQRDHVTSLGGRIPKGVLLVGPPGTGKTMLAKAIATEAGIPFFEISGSSFVEKFVGTGAARVRSLFKQARKQAPCILFIDELDAVGGSRSDSSEGAAREHNQTLNALLVEMDGASEREGVIVVAATNRKDSLDPALLRPGRFDRTLQVGLPDVKGREEILQAHGRTKRLGPDVSLRELAKATHGFSGAELSSLLNEAALIAGRRRAEEIVTSDLNAARDRILLGAERSSSKLNEREKWLTAIHEAGHTVINHFVPQGRALERVTIIPRGGALGVTLMIPDENKYGETRLKLLDTICVLMGGRAAEEVFLGDISTGASGDIQMATRYAKKMVCEWGMSPSVGMVRYEGRSEEFLSTFGSGGREIETEVQRIVKEQYDRSVALVRERRSEVELLARELVERESLTADQVRRLLAASSEPVATRTYDTTVDVMGVS
jgi:cell division protease FtsH